MDWLRKRIAREKVVVSTSKKKENPVVMEEELSPTEETRPRRGRPSQNKNQKNNSPSKRGKVKRRSSSESSVEFSQVSKRVTRNRSASKTTTRQSIKVENTSDSSMEIVEESKRQSKQESDNNSSKSQEAAVVKEEAKEENKPSDSAVKLNKKSKRVSRDQSAENNNSKRQKIEDEEEIVSKRVTRNQFVNNNKNLENPKVEENSTPSTEDEIQVLPKKKKVNYAEQDDYHPSDSDNNNDSSSSSSAGDSDGDDLYTVKEKVHGRGRPKKRPKTNDDGHEDLCRICNDGGSVVCCDGKGCPHVYHLKCLNPPVSQLPEGDWLCPRCACELIDGQVKEIVTWKWDETEEYRKEYFSAPPSKQKYMAQPRRKYFVHFCNKSYWDCAWVTTIQMQVYHPGMIHAYKTQEEPPQLFEDEDEAQDYYAEFQEGVENGLKERFYDNGVKPNWLKIQRILNHKTDKKDGTSYLVKWKDLPYDFATFESLENCPDPLLVPEFEKQIKIYKEFRHHFESQDSPKKNKKRHKYKHITVGPSKSTSNLKEKYEYGQDLPFIDTAGGLGLHDYQLDGLNWLRYSYDNGTPTILADEMGLGKTIQAITFMYSLYKEGHCSGPFLVSAPLSTIVNWERELEIWGPDFYVVTYCGHKESRQVLREHELTYDEKAVKKLASNQLCKVKGKAKFHVLLTSYEYVTKDAICLGSIDWACIIVDEAHRLKSGSSSFFQSLSKYKTNYKLLLTGTPLQNNLIELYHLLNYLSPLKFCDLDEFLSEFSDVSKEEQIVKLQQLLGPHMLRRLKSDVLKSIPLKSEFLVRVELSPQQKEFYKHILTRNYSALNSKVGGKKASLITILMELKKCCNHPYLFSSASMSAPVVHENEDDERYELEALTASSGKFILLRKMLAKLQQQGHRVLIFSQMTKVLDLLEDFLNGLGYSFERIDGSIRGSDRQIAIDRFNDPKSKSLVFLLSTKAGGLGINLATADTVIIYDSDWNPHSDIQAMSRSHRIGQKNKVLIYRFVTRKSVEERVMEVCKKKMLLTQLVVETNRNSVKGDQMSFSKQEIETILKFGAENLFKDDKNAEIVYTDEQIDKLLDRNQLNDTEDRKEEHWINEYLSSFKVATYLTNDDQPPENGQQQHQPATQNDQVVDKDKINENDPNYWQKLLNSDGKLDEEKLLMCEDFGRGKRESKYRGNLPRSQGQDDDNDDSEDDDYSGSGSSVEFDSDQYEFDEDYDPARERMRKKLEEKQRAKEEAEKRMLEERKKLEEKLLEEKKLFEEKMKELNSKPGSVATALTSTNNKQIQEQKQLEFKLKQLKKLKTNVTTTTNNVNKNTAYYYYTNILFRLSPQLSSIMGGQLMMTRQKIVLELRKIITQNGMWDPTDPRFVVSKGVIIPIFGNDRFNIIDLFRYLDKHLEEVPVDSPLLGAQKKELVETSSSDEDDKEDESSSSEEEEEEHGKTLSHVAKSISRYAEGLERQKIQAISMTKQAQKIVGQTSSSLVNYSTSSSSSLSSSFSSSSTSSSPDDIIKMQQGKHQRKTVVKKELYNELDEIPIQRKIQSTVINIPAFKPINIPSGNSILIPQPINSAIKITTVIDISQSSSSSSESDPLESAPATLTEVQLKGQQNESKESMGTTEVKKEIPVDDLPLQTVPKQQKEKVKTNVLVRRSPRSTK